MSDRRTPPIARNPATPSAAAAGRNATAGRQQADTEPGKATSGWG
jgi:hypothetical protein